MSRTFRRANFERENPEQSGSKIAGFYTEMNWQPGAPKHGTPGLCEWRAPSRQEKLSKYWSIHADQGKGFFSRPGRYVRRQVDRDLKSHDDQELRKYLRQPDEYEPQFWVMKPIDWREWD